MPFTKTSRTHLRAVSLNHDEYALKAEKYLRQAEEVGARTSGRHARCIGLEPQQNQCIMAYPSASELQTKHELKLTVQAAQGFRLAGEQYWFDSAKAYAKAAALWKESFKDPKKAAELYKEAAIVIEKIDSDFANEYYRKAISQHCDASQYKSAAILEERMANNHRRKKNFESSIQEYERASKLYTAANEFDSADRTLDQTAYFLGKVGRVRDSAYSYQSLAKEQQANQNMKKFEVPRTMLRVGLLLLCDCLQKSPKLDFFEIRQTMEEMYEVDCRFEESSEHAFFVDMVKCAAQGDLDKYVDCLHSFNLLSKFDDLMLDALEGIKTAVAERANMVAKEVKR
eukprot:CAMPEP_0181112206 /NCGR_PEP_ID=MMETSP1071-20121207/19692_1 /TAXON_ID=35127 /ORGANISM="Thalassiosira sp., Strain NH16" /LENGTH=341 /DNA_ID=CAMNT_0023196165 /DNA_START=676 /DNA_END=1701 /DNA_ORIENTATION=-